jgi:predicted ATPase
LWLPYFLALLADAVGHAGQPAERLDCWSGARLERVAGTGECWFEAELHRPRGEYLLTDRAGESAAAEFVVSTPLPLRGSRGAKPWELRAATSLARLWAERGKRDQAHDLLAPVYDWFTEGFDTRDLKDARALLDELS